MAKSKFTTDQILTKLREVDMLCKTDKTITEAVECVGINEKTYYRWRKKYGWMTEDEYQKLKKLETENMRLKDLVQLWVTVFGEQGAMLKMEGNQSLARQAYDRRTLNRP